MPTALSTINVAKEQAATYPPLLLCEFTFADGAVYRVASLPLNAAEGGVQYGGQNYYGRVMDYSIGQISAQSDTGINIVPNATVTLADPDAYVYTNYEAYPGRGFRGAVARFRIVFYDPIGKTFSSDSRIPFYGRVESATVADCKKLVITCSTRSKMMRAYTPCVPIIDTCPWLNPTTTAERATADDPNSKFYQCGETRDLTTAPPCSYQKASCTRPNNRASIEYSNTATYRVKPYTTGKEENVTATTNQVNAGDYFPEGYGTFWIYPKGMNCTPDGNYNRSEFVVGYGQYEILKVVANGIELDAMSAWDGTAYTANNKDFRWGYINRGNRTGAPNADATDSASRDPYGSLTAITVVGSQAQFGTSMPTVRCLVKRVSGRMYQAISSITVTSEVAVATLVGANTNIASNSATWAYAISGSASSALNKSYLGGLTNWTAGPPGTFTFTAAGVSDGTYAGGYIEYEAYCENAMWVLLDLLKRSGWDTSEFDLSSFTATAAKVASKNCSFAIVNRETIAEAVRSVCAGFGIKLNHDTETGLLSARHESTLADEQPSAISGSNYNTAISSVLPDGTTQNGYAAYHFDASSRLRKDQPSSIRAVSRSASEMFNYGLIAFQDRTRDYAESKLQIYDTDDVARMGDSISGSPTITPRGLTSKADAQAIGNRLYAETLRGNEQGDTRGTRWFEFETSFRALHLKVGQLVIVTETRLGLDHQLFRVMRISPASNYETMTITVRWHDDEWYTDAWALTGASSTTAVSPSENRTPYVWCPNSKIGQSGDALYQTNRATFSVYPGQALVRVNGALPQNRTDSLLSAPHVPLQATTSSTGGLLDGPARLLFGIAATDASGNIGPMSYTVVADITGSGSANSVTISGVTWPTGATGYIVYAGRYTGSMCAQAVGSGTPSSVTVTGALRISTYAPIDTKFDHLRLYATRVRAAGVYVGALASLTSTTLTFSGVSWTTNEWAGRVVSILSGSADGWAPLAHAVIASNNADTLTIAVDFTAAGAIAGSMAVIRASVTGAGPTLTDAAWGLTADAEVGKLARVIGGAGAGQERRITANTATSITLESAFDTALVSASVVLIEEPSPDVASDTTSAPSNSSSGQLTMEAALPNQAAQIYSIRGASYDSDGNSAPLMLCPQRDVYVSSVAVGEAVAPVSPTAVAATATDEGTSTLVALALTLPADTGGNVGYAIQRRTYSDKDGTVLVSTESATTAWGASTTAAAVSIFKTSAIQYVRMGAAGLNSANTVSDYALSDVLVIPASEEATPNVVPPDPTAVTVAVIDNPANTDEYGLLASWTPGTPAGSTSGFDIEFKFSGGSSANEWMHPLTAGKADTSRRDGYWAKPLDAAQNVDARVRARNAYGTVGAWVQSAAAATVGTASGAVATPTQPSAAQITVSVASYGADSAGKQVANIRAVVSLNASDVDYFTAWQYQGSAAPADPSAYKVVANQPQASSGSTTLDWWVDCDDAASITLQIVITGCSSRYTAMPSASSPVQSVSVDPATVSAQPAAFSVSVNYDDAGANNGGVPSGQFVFSITAPSDKKYFYSRISRIACDSSFNPVTGASYGTVATVVDDSDANRLGGVWNQPKVAEYWKFKAEAVTRMGKVNSTAPLTFNITVKASGGIDGSMVKDLPVASLAAGLDVVHQVYYVPNSSGELAVSKVGNLVFNTYDNKLYRWDSSAYVYKHKVDSNDFYADSVTVGVIKAGAVNSASMAGNTLTLGYNGTSNPPLLQVLDSGGSVLAAMGNWTTYSFVGVYAQRMRIAPSFSSSQRIEASSSGLAVENVPLTMTGSSFLINVSSSLGLKIQNTSSGDFVQMAGNGIALASSSYNRATLTNSGLGLMNSTGATVASLTSGSGGALTLLDSAGSNSLVLQASGITSSRASTSIALTGSGSFINTAGGYKVNSTLIINASGYLQWPTVYSETNALSGLTATMWVPVYDTSGTYRGKLLVIP